MFLGSHDHVLDEKGRTSLPKPFRESLREQEGEPWLTALPKCLTLFPAAVFEALAHKLIEASSVIEEIQALQGLILGKAVRSAIDRQGRILVPRRLREWATLDREIVFVGVGKRIDIWNPARLDAGLEPWKVSHSSYTAILKDFNL
jgi:MraZ protein